MRNIREVQSVRNALLETLNKHQAEGRLKYEKVRIVMVNKELSIKITFSYVKPGANLASEYRGVPIIVEVKGS
jgi:hypothetical protein